jgi:NadR type nicotinamide-nucleotide adenylyltransferase
VIARIAVVGVESTGTTTLARALADHYGAPFVPEYGRDFAASRIAAGATGDWRTHEHFAHIASRQAELEHAAGDGLVICDTDVNCVCVYEERYLGTTSPPTEAIARERTYALAILCTPDIPFIHDGVRDAEHLRERMTDRLRDRLAAKPWPLVEVAGPHENRLADAIDSISVHLRR